MKKIVSKLSFIVVAFMALFLVSCGEDYPNTGYFLIDDVSYNINEASLLDLGYDNESELYQLRLTMDNTVHNDFHSINVLFYSEVNTYLPSGVYFPYLYDGQYKDRFKRGAWMIGDEIGGLFLSGNVKVTKTNDLYKIRINCKDVEGRTIIAEYDGEIKIVK